MNLAEPILSVVPSVTGSVLAALARTTESVTGRGLEDRVKPRASHRGVQEALGRLVRAGIVHRVDKGNSALYSLNRTHLAAPAIVELARLRDQLFERMASEVERWEIAPRSLVVFGSLARGQGGPESDVDVLVVRPERVVRTDEVWREQLTSLSEQVWAWTGNPLRLIELSEDGFASEVANEEPYLNEATREGLTIAGVPLARLRVTTA